MHALFARSFPLPMRMILFVTSCALRSLTLTRHTAQLSLKSRPIYTIKWAQQMKVTHNRRSSAATCLSKHHPNSWSAYFDENVGFFQGSGSYDKVLRPHAGFRGPAAVPGIVTCAHRGTSEVATLEVLGDKWDLWFIYRGEMFWI